MSQPIETVGYTITHDDFVQTNCLSISLKNKGTASVLVNETIPIDAGEFIVLPYTEGCLYVKSLSVKFGSSGTKKLLVIKLITV